MREIEAALRARHRHVHEAALFGEPLVALTVVAHGREVREDPLFEPHDEDVLEFQPLGRVHGHELHGVDGLRFVLVARFEGRLREEALQGREAVLVEGREGVDVKAHSFVLAVPVRGRHDFVHVGDAVFAFAFLLVVGLKARTLNDETRHFGEGLSLGLFTKRFDERTEGDELGRHRTVFHRERAPEARLHGARFERQVVDRLRADPAGREVHDAQKARVVRRVVEKAHVGEDVLHFGALEEALAAVDAEGNPGVGEGLFENARLRVHAVENGAVGVVVAARAALHDEALDVARLFGVVVEALQQNLVARRTARPEILPETIVVVGNDGVRGVQDRRGRAVVLLEADGFARAEVAHEVGHVPDVCAAEGVDRLVVVAHGEDGVHARVLAARAEPREDLEPAVLQNVRVLKLVDEDVAEAPLIVRAHDFVAVEKFVAAKKKFPEVDDPFALTGLFIGAVEVHLLGEVFGELLRPGADAVLLLPVDVALDLARVHRLGVDVVGLHDALHHRELIARVEDLEGFRQSRRFGVTAQNAVAQAVESPHPHVPQVVGEHRLETREHFARGLVREGHGEDFGRAAGALFEEPRDAGRQNAGLSRARARQDEDALFGRRHGLKLPLVEIFQNVCHRGRLLWSVRRKRNCCCSKLRRESTKLAQSVPAHRVRRQKRYGKSSSSFAAVRSPIFPPQSVRRRKGILSRYSLPYSTFGSA